MNFIVILATMAAFWHRECTATTDRKGKFLGFSGDDFFSDILDEASDPLPLPRSRFSVRTRILQKLRQDSNPQPTQITPQVQIPVKLVQKLAEPPAVPASTILIEQPSKSSVEEKPIMGIAEPLVLYDTSTSKFEILPPGFASQAPPVTESMFLFGGQFGQRRPTNSTEQKIFWSSIGDFIEAVPFLPIQVNVPDLLQAMASFFTQRFPQRNPNEPRPHIKMPEPSPYEALSYSDLPIDNNILEYRQMSKSTPRPKKKKKKQHKRKTTKRSTTENYLIRGSHIGRTTTQEYEPQMAAKRWFERPTQAPVTKSTAQSKLFNRKQSANEHVNYKNMPFTKQRTRYADKELFNFKHSDISNSPIMILNMPHRPVVMYKVRNEQKSEMPYQKTNTLEK